jgi:uncharacterized membrane protein YhhN
VGYHLIPIPFSIVVIILYTLARTRYEMRKTQILQPIMTSLAVIIGILSFFSANAVTGFSAWIVAGLVASLIADLMHIDMRKDNVLMIGIIGFTVAYLLYPIGITVYNGFHMQDIVVGIALLLGYLWTIKTFWPVTAGFRAPILIYSLVCPFMVSRAVSTFFGDTFSLTQAVLLTVGTTLLYLGDVEYGFHRFISERKFLFGHLCYGFGQVLIALSPSYFLV